MALNTLINALAKGVTAKAGTLRFKRCICRKNLQGET